MDLLPTDEQNEITNTVRTQLAADFELNDLAERDWSASVLDGDIWQRCAELGWFALGLSEADGGVGYGLPEEVLLFEQLGRHATPGPFLATVLAAHVAAAAGESDLVAAILGGTARVALAEVEAAPVSTAGALSGGAAPGGESTTRLRVTDFGGADLLLVLDGASAILVNAEGLEFSADTSFDPLVPLAVAAVDLSGERVVCDVNDELVALRATVLTAAELAGMAAATTDQSVEYAKDREQFGRPVGSFQAVKHRCADMAVRADAALQLTRLAALAVAGGHDDATFQAESARLVATDAAVTNAETNVQNHGGIGFTYEHSAHRYVTRARMRAATAGNRSSHCADLLAAPSPS